MIMRQNILEGGGRPQNKIWNNRTAYSITTATNTRSYYVAFIAFPLEQICTNAPQCYVIRTFAVLLSY